MLEERDPRINWELGWKAIRYEIKRIKRGRDEDEKLWPLSADQLFDLRLEASHMPTLDIIMHMKALEEEVCWHERLSTNLWHIRSFSTWLKIGDAPSQYFLCLSKPRGFENPLRLSSCRMVGPPRTNSKSFMGSTPIARSCTRETLGWLPSMRFARKF